MPTTLAGAFQMALTARKSMAYNLLSFSFLLPWAQVQRTDTVQSRNKKFGGPVTGALFCSRSGHSADRQVLIEWNLKRGALHPRALNGGPAETEHTEVSKFLPEHGTQVGL